MDFGTEFATGRIRTSGADIHFVHGGKGPPLLLLHGYPQTHVMWHRVAPELARDFHVVCPDLRGYGDSSKPPSDASHSAYAKRAMAMDMVELMSHLGHPRFAMAGHDRGARVAHRMALDHPERVSRVCVMDIVPTLHMFRHTDQNFATGYYHWFFLIQPHGLPEHMIGMDPDYFLREKLNRWSGPDASFEPDAVSEYLRCFRDPRVIHASCEDYRAAASIDLEHDEYDRTCGKTVRCPLLVLWGSKGFVNRTYDVETVWQDYADTVEGRVLDCGHFLPEEAPVALLAELRRWHAFSEQ
ncbi:MAG: alpha/beta hydrolase [Marinobacter sp.]|uniref:alpha/beta fold hydrolase n=1 Tax=Marinobacter sp. TaxID=50741 RepID=UPI00397702FB